MKKGLTELVFILDRSGSMSGLEKETIGGYNSMIMRQKKQEGEARVTTVLFDNYIETICDRSDIRKVKPMTEKEYYVRGCTSLLDAVGGTIAKIVQAHKETKPEYVPEKTIVVITTDGLENSSKRYDYREVKKMISLEQEKYGWEFIFLGANIDVAREADRLGIRKERAVAYENDSVGIEMNYKAVDMAISAMRCAPCMSQVDDSWSKEIRERKNKK